ncbi:MAG: tetratricopeptide repeat protein [Bryobacteraceae bacterium]
MRSIPPRGVALALLCTALPLLCSEADRYELRGRLVPGTRASVWLHGATSPFEDSTLADGDGKFRFRGLLPGSYTLGAFVPGRGEVRRTIDLGPSGTDAKGRLELTINLDETQFESRDSLRRGALVSARELAIPDAARREFDDAQKALSKRDVQAAVTHLERAVRTAPRFSAAWNHLGTIAYQSQEYPKAENCFRQALDADSSSFEPLVNLGGVLVNLRKYDEALQYNRHAVLTRPNDALANSQLGMTYYFLNQPDLAKKHLIAAKQIDPAHFSHPQLLLAEIYSHQGQRDFAARELEEFLTYHPDSPDGAKIRKAIAQLRSPAPHAPQPAAPKSDPAKALAATGMGQSLSTLPKMPLLNDLFDTESGRHFTVAQSGDGLLLRVQSGGDFPIDAVLGSGRHAQILLTRTKAGKLAELPLAWYAAPAGHYGLSPGFGGRSDGAPRELGAECLACHTSGNAAGHLAAIDCQNCHSAGTPTQAACLGCHLSTPVSTAGHGAAPPSEEPFLLNSAAYRLLGSHCYQASGKKLACANCHPAHGFMRTEDGYREVCRSCHPTTHKSAALNCVRCHMPKRPVQDAAGIEVTDHRIQRPT